MPRPKTTVGGMYISARVPDRVLENMGKKLGIDHTSKLEVGMAVERIILEMFSNPNENGTS